MAVLDPIVASFQNNSIKYVMNHSIKTPLNDNISLDENFEKYVQSSSKKIKNRSVIKKSQRNIPANIPTPKGSLIRSSCKRPFETYETVKANIELVTNYTNKNRDSLQPPKKVVRKSRYCLSDSDNEE